MEREAVLQHLRAWADGVDPATGMTLPADHPGQRPDTLRVVFAALAWLASPDPATVSSASGGAATRTMPPARSGTPPAAPRNAGRPWSSDDDDALAAGFDAGQTIGALATQLARTRGAINARLVKLGKIDPPPGLRLRGMAAPYTDLPATA